MDSAVFVSAKSRKILGWIEWFLLAHCLLSTPTSIAFEPSFVAYLQLVLFVGAIGVLSLFFPVDRPLWQRRLYIALEMAILVPTVTLPLNDFLFFELFVIKACLLISRKDVIIATTIAASLFLGQIIYQLPTLIERSRINSVEYFDQPGQIIFDTFLEYVVTYTFVIFFGVMFAAEQRSRHRAEVLAKEVEALATKLERARIARDIHDSLGHSLTTLDVQLALAQRYSQSTNDSSKLQHALSTAQQLATQCLAEARQSLHTMREPSFNLKDALNTLAEQVRQSFVINLQVEVPLQLPQQLSYQIYLMVKEGLSNVQKHAEATRVTLSVVADNAQMVVTLIDDGCGFDVSEVEGNAIAPGYGLRGMKERSQLLGGQLTVESHLGQGTQLQVTVPLRTATSEPDQEPRQNWPLSQDTARLSQYPSGELG